MNQTTRQVSEVRSGQVLFQVRSGAPVSLMKEVTRASERKERTIPFKMGNGKRRKVRSELVPAHRSEERVKKEQTRLSSGIRERERLVWSGVLPLGSGHAYEAAMPEKRYN